MIFKMHHLLFMALFFKWANDAVTADGDASFKSFCANPPNFGVGDYDDEKQKCHITYNVKSADDDYAQGFCDKQHPYTLEKAEAKGDLTVCHLAVYYKCEVNEFLIKDRCYTVQREVHYSAAASTCTDLGRAGMSIHKIASVFEQKWIAAFFTSYKVIWISNNAKDLTNLKVASFEGMVLNNMEGGLVRGTPEHFAIITSKGALASARGGTIIAMSNSPQLPVLCSRSASTNKEYDTAFAKMMREVGIVLHFYKSHDGKYRPFTILRVLVGYEMDSEFGAGVKRLHYACKSLINGYAATPLDFENVDDFKELLKKEGVNIVGVPGRRSTDITMKNTPCVRDDRYEYFRRHFYFELNNGGLKSANIEKYWRPTFPDRYCADSARVALGFSQEGLVDIPNIARMFVTCTIGQELTVTEDESRPFSCSIHASYDKKTDSCHCVAPFTDIRFTKMFIRTEKDKNQKSGHFCVNCNRAYDHEIAIVIENTHESTVNKDTTLRILRILAYMGFVTKSRMRLYWFNNDYDMGSYRTPSLPLERIRRHFEDDYPESTGDGTKLWTPLNSLYHYFKVKPTSRKIAIMILSTMPSDLDEAIVVAKKLSQIYMASEVFSYFKDDRLDPLSSHGKSYHIKRNNYDDVAELTSHVQQAMLRNSCLAD